MELLANHLARADFEVADVPRQLSLGGIHGKKLDGRAGVVVRRTGDSKLRAARNCHRKNNGVGGWAATSRA